MIGLGSIGRKHLENVVAVLIEHNMKYEIDALRSIPIPFFPNQNPVYDKRP